MYTFDDEGYRVSNHDIGFTLEAVLREYAESGITLKIEVDADSHYLFEIGDSTTGINFDHAGFAHGLHNDLYWHLSNELRAEAVARSRAARWPDIITV
jgi:hypothetical protein